MKKIPKIDFKKQEGGKQAIGIEVVDIEKILDGSTPLNHNPHKHHRINFFAVLIITRGSVKHQLDFQTIQLSKGDSLIISIGRAHAFDHQSYYYGKLVLFTEAFMHQHLTKSTINKVDSLYNYFLSPVKYTAPELNDSFLNQLSQVLDQPNELCPNIAGALLTTYLLQLKASSTKFTISLNDQHISQFLQFKKLLEASYANSRDAMDYAEQMSISYKHLNFICKKTVNKTAKSFIDAFVTLEIKRQLIATTQSIKEIAYKNGFNEPTNFVKYFKKQEGLTPNDFRMSYL